MEDSADVVIIGAGAGGLCAGARLAHAGKRVVVLESDHVVGGRWSTRSIDGFLVSTGAVAIELDGVLQATFELVGAPFDVRIPERAVSIRVRGLNLEPGGAVWRRLTSVVTKRAGHLAEALHDAKTNEPDLSVTLDQWVRRYTRSSTVRSLFQSLSASIFTVNSDEIPAAAFLRLLSATGGYKRIGFAPCGNIQLAASLAGAIESDGGLVVTGVRVTGITSAENRITGVHFQLGDQHLEISTPIVVSNAGPRHTASLVTDPSARVLLHERVAATHPTSIIALTLASKENLIEVPGIWTFTDTKRLCNIANLSGTCPEHAPPGWHLFDAYSVPRPSIGGAFDAEAEIEYLWRDLETLIPGARSRTRTIHTKILRGDVPAQHSRPGHDVSPFTPLEGLYEVGDGVKPFGWIGTTACAETARVVADYICSVRPSPPRQ